MIEPREAKYQWGQRITAMVDLFNDGSYPDREPEALLVGTGTQGEIVNVGYHEELNLPVYLVEFQVGGVVGCLEEEITPA
jgi:nitrogen fixation protein NifZ